MYVYKQTQRHTYRYTWRAEETALVVESRVPLKDCIALIYLVKGAFRIYLKEFY